MEAWKSKINNNIELKQVCPLLTLFGSFINWLENWIKNDGGGA